MAPVKAVWSSNMREKTETPSNEMGEIEKIVALNRVAKVVKGGRRFSFSALVVVGDGKGNVGFGLGKAQEVPEALRKATDKARKTRVFIPLVDGTLPCEVLGRFGAGRVMLLTALDHRENEALCACLQRKLDVLFRRFGKTGERRSSAALDTPEHIGQNAGAEGAVFHINGHPVIPGPGH